MSDINKKIFESVFTPLSTLPTPDAIPARAATIQFAHALTAQARSADLIHVERDRLPELARQAAPLLPRQGQAAVDFLKNHPSYGDPALWETLVAKESALGRVVVAARSAWRGLNRNEAGGLQGLSIATGSIEIAADELSRDITVAPYLIEIQSADQTRQRVADSLASFRARRETILKEGALTAATLAGLAERDTRLSRLTSNDHAALAGAASKPQSPKSPAKKSKGSPKPGR